MPSGHALQCVEHQPVFPLFSTVRERSTLWLLTVGSVSMSHQQIHTGPWCQWHVASSGGQYVMTQRFMVE
jgi:hypothetical protein